MRATLLILCSLLAATELICGVEAEHTNVLQATYGGPYASLPRDLRIATSNFALQLMKGAGEATLRNGPHLKFIFDSVLLPSLKPLQSGTAEEKKVFEAAQAVRRAYLYVSENLSKRSTWEDETLNKLIRLRKDEDRVPRFSLEALAADFFQMADPNGFKEFLGPK